MNALDTYLKANGGLERKVIVTLLPRQYETEGPFGFTEHKTIDFDRLLVWADNGLLDTFKAIPGVMLASQDKDAGVRFIISVDPRYSTKWVIAEIEAAAQLYEPKQPEPAPDPDSLYYPAEWRPTYMSGNTTNT
jgi:hypothetical protein